VRLVVSQAAPCLSGDRQAGRPIRERRHQGDELGSAVHAFRDFSDGFVMNVKDDREAGRLQPEHGRRQ